MTNAISPGGAALLLTLILVPIPGSHVSDPQGKLTPTAHAALPDDPSGFWFVPSAGDGKSRDYAQYEPLAEAV